MCAPQQKTIVIVAILWYGSTYVLTHETDNACYCTVVMSRFSGDWLAGMPFSILAVARVGKAVNFLQYYVRTRIGSLSRRVGNGERALHIVDDSVELENGFIIHGK